MRATLSSLFVALAACLALAAPTASRADTDPGVAQISAFDDVLLATMKQGAALGMNGRYKKLEPAVQRAFDLPTMTRYAIGPAAWAKFSAGDQRALIDAFTRLSVASFAKNFSSYGGEQFTVDPAADNRGLDKIVKTQLAGSGAPVVLDYRMRQSGGTWKVIDVLFQGSISQLTTRRSDLAAVVAAGDPKAIAAHLNAQADKLLK